MSILKDIIYVNKESAKNTFTSLGKNWQLFFTGLVYTILATVVYTFMSILFQGPFSLFAGIISAIINSALISNYLYLLYNVVNYNRLTVQNFKDGFTYFLRKIYGVFFLAYLLSMIISLLNNMLAGDAWVLDLILTVFMGVFLNALPETIYQKSYNSLDSVSYALEFMRDNWLNWLIPNAILFLIMYSLTGNFFGKIFATHISFSNIFTVRELIMAIVGQLIFTFGMIYRGHLFKILSSGSRRKRQFMNQY